MSKKFVVVPAVAACAIIVSGCGDNTADAPTTPIVEDPIAAIEESATGAMDKMEEKAMEAGEMMEEKADEMMKEDAGTVVDGAIASADHTTLVAAVQAAGLVETLSGEGPFTVFAPVNAAFDALPAGTVENLLLPESKDALTGILTYHVVPAKALSGDVIKMISDGNGTATVATVQGDELTLSLDGESVKITDGNGGVATVTAVDLEFSNGVIHVIDSVLLPAS